MLLQLFLLAFATCAVADDSAFKSFFDEIAHDNKAFVEKHRPDYFKGMSEKQHPIATMLLCSDSRVQDDAFDGNAIDNLFVVRNIGNQLETALGSVDYGVTVLKTPILIIVGHSGCGAISAAMHPHQHQDLSLAIQKEVQGIQIHPQHDLKDSVIDNVHRQVEKACNRYAQYIKDGNLMILGAIYDFKNDYDRGYGKFFVVNMNGQTPDNQKDSKTNLIQDLL